MSHSFEDGGKTWQQESEAAGHVAFVVKKQKEAHAGVQVNLSILFNSRPKPIKWSSPYLGCVSYLN